VLQNHRPCKWYSSESRKEYNVDFKNIYNDENFDDIKENPDVDIVHIILPNGMRSEYTIRAAKARKHVLCKKPMANTVEECQVMIDACKQANVKLMIPDRYHGEPWMLSRELEIFNLVAFDKSQQIVDSTWKF